VFVRKGDGKMKALMFLASMLVVGAPRIALSQTIVVFVDGTRMEVESYEVKEGIVLLKTKEGKLQSVPRSYVNLVATEQLKRGAPAPSPAPAAPKPAAPTRPAPPPPPAPSRDAMPTEAVEPEPAVPDPEPPPPPPPAPRDLPSSPPPVWSNDELQVSLVVPSSAWKLEDMPPSFDVAVALENETTEARATLALIRQKIRSKGDFRDVVQNVAQSISQAPGFRSLVDADVTLEPYTAHEFRFVKNVGFVSVYNRLVVVYSRDLAYVLSLTCPEAREMENQTDFEALVRGLVIKKSRKDLSF
jgi:hypothetical protein